MSDSIKCVIPNFVRSLHKLTEAQVDFDSARKCQSSFDTLKTLLSTALVLSYPDFKGEFVLDTDTSNHNVGAALRQVELPTADVRRKLLKAERNYCVKQKDLFALVKG